MGAEEERAQRAEERRRCAEQVLAETDFVARWSRLGDVSLVGSVALDLIVRPDIDMEVKVPTPRVADGFAVMTEVAQLPKARRITYLDARDRHEQGQYWKLEYELTPLQTWTVDCWVFDANQPDPGAGAMTVALRAALTEPARDAILRIKEEAWNEGERAYGYWLYQAVLEGGVRSYPEFRSWLGDRNVWERTGWLPTRPG